jgi:hypothetical protein
MDRPECVADDDVDFEPPSEALVEAFARSTSETGNVTTSSFMSMVPASGRSGEVPVLTSVLLMVTSVARSVSAAACRVDRPWRPGSA